MKKRHGFTLVELLAVIVILAIILAIAIPSITGIINNAKKQAFEDDTKMVLKALSYKLLEDEHYDVTTIKKTATEDTVASELKLDSSNYEMVTVGMENNKPYVIILGNDKWENLIAEGNANNITVDYLDNYYLESEGVNKPQLVTGMTPIKWSGSAWVNTTESDTDWYNYTTTDKKWANAKTADGSMWVWIPRYAYQIATNYHTSAAGTINVKFLIYKTNIATDKAGVTKTPTYSGSSQTNYIVHPAFTFGTTELSGIWVAKFEASKDGSNNVKIIPNVNALQFTTISNMFTMSRNMETNSVYGWGTTGTGIDTHLTKNVEWGAIAYLSQSTFGKNAEIWINPNSNSTTGCAGSTVSASPVATCSTPYNSTDGMKASTTGNIYGIYDISGGDYEAVAAYINNGNAALNDNGSAIISADSKYKDVYSVGATDSAANNYEALSSKKGDAIYETSSSSSGVTAWYSDDSIVPSAGYPWFYRGGFFSGRTAAGAFEFYAMDGNAWDDFGFRPVLIVDKEV